MTKPARKGVGFFTRLLDDVPPDQRYRLGIEQIEAAEKYGFDTVWLAQHHFHRDEGGLPSPFVFLANVAARTKSIRLGTAIVTLPLEQPLRVAEDAAVLDLLSNERLELGVGSGGTPSSFVPFAFDSNDRSAIYERNLSKLREALAGDDLGNGNRLYPGRPNLGQRIWQATFSVAGGRRAGAAGDGLMLSRTQPRSPDASRASLADLQLPIIEAYLSALPSNVAPRILASRSLFVADNRAEARRWADQGLRKVAQQFSASGHILHGDSLDDLIRDLDTHVGEIEDVVESLGKDRVLDEVTDVTFQVHSVDPPHPLILRSLELTASKVVPALGWRTLDREVARSAAV